MTSLNSQLNKLQAELSIKENTITGQLLLIEKQSPVIARIYVKNRSSGSLMAKEPGVNGKRHHIGTDPEKASLWRQRIEAGKRKAELTAELQLVLQLQKGMISVLDLVISTVNAALAQQNLNKEQRVLLTLMKGFSK